MIYGLTGCGQKARHLQGTGHRCLDAQRHHASLRARGLGDETRTTGNGRSTGTRHAVTETPKYHGHPLHHNRRVLDLTSPHALPALRSLERIASSCSANVEVTARPASACRLFGKPAPQKISVHGSVGRSRFLGHKVSHVLRYVKSKKKFSVASLRRSGDSGRRHDFSGSRHLQK